MYLGKRVPSGNSMAPSVLPKTNLFLRSVPEEALKQEDISPCSLVQLWNIFSAGWKQRDPVFSAHQDMPVRLGEYGVDVV